MLTEYLRKAMAKARYEILAGEGKSRKGSVRATVDRRSLVLRPGARPCRHGEGPSQRSGRQSGIFGSMHRLSTSLAMEIQSWRSLPPLGVRTDAPATKAGIKGVDGPRCSCAIAAIPSPVSIRIFRWNPAPRRLSEDRDSFRCCTWFVSLENLFQTNWIPACAELTNLERYDSRPVHPALMK